MRDVDEYNVRGGVEFGFLSCCCEHREALPTVVSAEGKGGERRTRRGRQRSLKVQTGRHAMARGAVESQLYACLVRVAER